MSKSFKPNAPRPASAQSVAPPATSEKPSLVRQAPVSPKGDAPSAPAPMRDAITVALGATWFVTGQRIDGCVDGFGRRYLFSRWYPEKRVYVDAFAKASDASKLEAARKSAFLSAYNAEHESKIGYLPYVVGAEIREDDAQLAALGEVVPLLTPPQLQVA